MAEIDPRMTPAANLPRGVEVYDRPNRFGGFVPVLLAVVSVLMLLVGLFFLMRRV